MFKETRAFFEKYGFRDIVPVQWFDTNDIAIGAMPGQLEFFNAAPAFAISNLEEPNRLPYPTIIMALGVQTFGTIADSLVVFEGAEITFEKDQKQTPSMPVCAVPGGGGINADGSQTNAAVGIEVVTNGLGNSFRNLQAPIAVEPGQNIRAWLLTNAAAVAAATGVRVILEGFMARRIV